MHSYCYTCKIDRELGETRFEEYEVKNGMKPLWVNIHQAIAHNEQTMAESPKKGMSIERETFLLRLIAKELL
ncbi:TPA: DNA mismatch repair protein MutT, partial [Vibrio vulnificus]|nr:DNA mismatch repair protein MutT [Vibrio vulnificus]